MAHPAQSAIDAARRSPNRVAKITGKGGAVDASSWRPPVAHDVQPLNQEVIETSLDKRKGIADSKGDIPARTKY